MKNLSAFFGSIVAALALSLLVVSVGSQVIMTGGNRKIFSAGTPTASTPTFSPGAGSYTSGQSVTISATTGGVICWNTTGSPATNGTTGCTTGTLYSGAISVSATETLYAVAGGTGYLDSSVGSAAYTLPLFTDNFSGSGALSASWTNIAVGGFTGTCVQGSGVAYSSTGSNCIAFINSVSFSATSQSIQAALTGGWSGLALNIDASGNGVYYAQNPAPYALYTLAAGVKTSLASCSGGSAGGHTMKMSVSGTTYTVYDVTASATVCTGTASGYSGSPGIFAYGTGSGKGTVGPVATNF
jgi:hypothetical protein